jgi:hypothetical protein
LPFEALPPFLPECLDCCACCFFDPDRVPEAELVVVVDGLERVLAAAAVDLVLDDELLPPQAEMNSESTAQTRIPAPNPIPPPPHLSGLLGAPELSARESSFIDFTPGIGEPVGLLTEASYGVALWPVSDLTVLRSGPSSI